MKPLSFFLGLLSILGLCNAQTFNYSQYTVENGLANSNVYISFQDSKNFIWLGTEGGVNRFDGKTFDTFTTQDGLADNDVLRIFEDRKGRIWFLTIGGHLSYYLDGKIYNEKTDPYLSKAFTGAGFFYAFEDHKERIWFCSYNAIASVLDGRDIFKIKIEKSYPNFGLCADEDSSGNIFLYSSKSKYLFNEKNKTINEIDSIPTDNTASYYRSPDGNCYYITRFQDGKPNNGIYKIKKSLVYTCILFSELKNITANTTIGDDKGNIFISTINGAYIVNQNNRSEIKIQQYLPGEWINSMNYDKEGNLWFMTRRNGVFILPNQFKENILYNSPVLENESVFSLAKDNSGRIWIGCSNGKLAFLEKDSIHKIELPESNLKKGNFLSLVRDQIGNIWAGTDGHVYKITIDANTNTIINVISDKYYERTLHITFNSHNQAMLSCPLYTASVNIEKDKLVIIPSMDEGYQKRNYTSFFDKSDKLYVANIDGFYESINGHLNNLSPIDSLLRNKIIHIQQTPDSTLLLSTDGHGLIFFKHNKVVGHLSRKNGIPSDLIKKTRSFKDKIFICTNKGLTEFTYKNDSMFDFINFNSSNGLPSNDVRDVVITDQNIYVGTAKGLCILKNMRNKSNTLPPPIYIRSVINNSKFINWKNPFHLSNKDNELTINFNAISFSNYNDISYEYSLDKDTSKWKAATQTTLTFPDIPSGKYVFSIKAKKKNSAWSKPESFLFTIDPPFYRTFWFELLAILCFFGGLSLIVIYINRRKMRVQLLMLEKRNALNMERNRISADMHDDFGSDLSKIAVIAELIKIKGNDEEILQNNLHKISDFVTGARRKMDDIIWALNPSNDSAGSLIGYINQYCLNFFEGTDTRVEIQFKAVADDVVLNARQRRNLFLVIKEIANNTLKHSMATKFYLSFSINKKEIEICVGDNGIGIPNGQKKKYSNGLKNIDQRIKELSGKMKLETGEGSGMKFEIIIPLYSTL
jgi:signal transduction histidine kinase/ligand-binding sensor domain-containing protein